MARIPTRFDLSMTPAGRFLQLQQPQTPRPQSRMTARDALGRISTAGPRLPSAGPQPDPRAPFGFRKDVMDRLTGIQPTMEGMGTVPSLPPKKPMSLMERLSPEFGTPASAGLGAAAATGLQMSGYSPTPISTAQGLGAMMQSGMQAYTAEKKAQAAAELAKQQRDTDIRLKMMEIQAARGGKAFTQEKDLRKEFTAQSSEFSDALLGFEKVQNAAMSKKPSGASDIALVFGYMKVLDPNSVVREGEFATAANAGGVGETIRNYYNKIIEGTLLTDKVRKQFVSSARTQFQPYLTKQQAREDSFIGLTNSYGLDASKVVDSKMPARGTLALPYEVGSLQQAEELPKGSYVMINGRLARVK